MTGEGFLYDYLRRSKVAVCNTSWNVWHLQQLPIDVLQTFKKDTRYY